MATLRAVLALSVLAALPLPLSFATESDGCPDPGSQIPGSAGIHGDLDRLLRLYVRDGDVRYDCLAENGASLDGYLARIAEADLTTASREERFAYWINAYNAFTLRLILDYYPDLEGIRDIPRGKRWKDRRWLAGGRRLSLDQIEHEILRPGFGDPRLHFAIVCASVSCPALRSEAYVAETLDRQLEEQTREFLRDELRGVAVLRSNGGSASGLAISALFDWFEQDFTSAGTVLDFMAPYLDGEARRLYERYGTRTPLRFLDYDWSLNGR